MFGQQFTTAQVLGLHGSTQARANAVRLSFISQDSEKWKYYGQFKNRNSWQLLS